MKFFIDTANVEDIKKANDMGVISFWLEETKTRSWIVQIYDFSRGGLNARLCAYIQTLF